jgi:hypothetical protein
MTTTNRPGLKDTYLLRIWREDQETDWRVLVQNVRTGEKQGFPDVNALVTFLQGAYHNTNAARSAARDRAEEV